MNNKASSDLYKLILIVEQIVARELNACFQEENEKLKKMLKDLQSLRPDL